MDLFKSVLPEYDHHHRQQQPESPESTQSPLADAATSSSSSSSWSFGNLIKTLATKSESVIGSYRREFEEFGSELKKESSVIRQVASRAVKDIPGSLDIGASVAQESLESVGQAIDDIGATVWKSTAKIISHGKDSLLASSSHLDSSGDRGLSVKPYSRFEMQLLAIQSDKATYVREPDDLGDFEKWSLGFKLEERGDVIADSINENKAVKEMYVKIVPMEVDAETFWRRYYYKVHKLEEVEEARVKLVKRAISGQEEEDLSWDLDDEGDETEAEKARKVSEEEKVESREVSFKDSDISVISTQPSLPEVEDLGWDQMEDDIRSNEDKSTKEKPDWRRRVSVAEEEEDLTWDIEDDDHSVKQ